MKTNRLVTTLACVALALSLSSASAAPLDDPAMAGRWVGTADIVVNWTMQRTLRVELSIASDGTVTGKVGDAELSSGELRRNRGALGRALRIKTDYIVTGTLSGPILTTEGIRRDGRVSLPMHWREGGFQGGLHTAGSKFGGKEKMILSATHLKLEKKPATP